MDVRGRERSQSKMLANAPDVDRSTRTNRPLPEERAKGDVADVGSVGLPVRRVGLEQEFFLVDRGVC